MASLAKEMKNGQRTVQKKGKARLPPKRGSVKARIFGSFFRIVSPAASQTSEEGRNYFAIDDGIIGSSPSTTAPSSAHTSATNSGSLIPDQC